ncbi:MAG UNVERIFIED_CONTAM: hypothetical protein LVR29_04140 [Microcystis novacekii LVE1205-3]|jgi:hypothetical protein
MKGKLSEIAVDGGTVRSAGRSRAKKAFGGDIKTARLGGMLSCAFYQDNDSLVNWINRQKRTDPLFCIGDGHDGVWRLSPN